MPIKLKLALLTLMMSLAISVRAQSMFTNSYSQTVNTIVPDDNPNGINSTITVSGAQGAIQSVSIGMTVTNGFAGDYYAYVVDPAGDLAVLANRVGVGSGNPFGYSETGFNVTFSSLATNNIHFYQLGSYTVDGNGVLLGTWQADGRNIDPESTPSAFNTASTTTGLNLFPGTNPNGDWTFFIADMSGGYQGTLVDWNITVVSTPEPASVQLLAVAAAIGAGYGLRRHLGGKRFVQ